MMFLLLPKNRWKFVTRVGVNNNDNKKYSTCNKPLLRFDKFSNWNLMEMDSSDLQKTMCWWYCKSSNGFPHYSFILYLNLNLFTYVTYSIYLIVPNLSSSRQQHAQSLHSFLFSGDKCVMANNPHRNEIWRSVMFNARDVKTQKFIIIN